ncbi:urea carboxylase [Pseudomaricurvus alkylphenolicus]|uniref:urea carboxylase n=1 Tax=Pseudomaricurvus alkylphenolicus TaxID=1306991 RepID=UPI001421DC2D|nr:urea carboxylase [Pseudomaricurvus alkylphenolicus]NIB40690.1 urea carboxylase [Pseudomaricurvus alkylphenolicus]
MKIQRLFNTVLIANRGAIATRIIRTLKRLGIRAVAVYNEADAQSLHVQQADEAINLGSGSAADTYLDVEKILQAAADTGAEAIHPGYGFLSENTDFVQACEAQNIAFIGPTAQQMTLFGLKHQARELAIQADVPLVPGSPLLQELSEALDWANDVGYPIMLKSTAGGGGIGMQVCHDHDELKGAWQSVKRLGENYFANDGVFLEKYVANARHIEVQVFGDGQGTAISFGERDCSAQRRNQKVIEETPAPNLAEEKREQLHRTAERLMASVNYRNAGTVEFIYDVDSDQFYFLEVNTRLQVEHGVTEEVWGVDLVELMLKQAAGVLGDLQALKAQCQPRGHAVQVRVYAEDPNQDFRPSAGLLSEVSWPEAEGLRIDHWIESGTQVPALFDPMLAKVIVHANNRETALARLNAHLSESAIYGIETNRDYVRSVLQSPVCTDGRLLTRSLATHSFYPATFQVLNAGTQTTVQDYPGRQHLWHIGVPPSGPMDSLSFRLANQLVGNDSEAAALEITLNGPTLQFNRNCCVAITGASIEAELDGQAVALQQTLYINAGQTLRLGKVQNSGSRSYLAVAGGIQCPDYLGSKSTFALGQFGGHAGRALRVGDVLHFAPDTTQPPIRKLSDRQQPSLPKCWTLRVIYGPHGAPDFFTDTAIEEFFNHEWEVHYNSSRTGVRLIGPKPEWARETGGEAGLHPSNIHDNAYAFGTVDFTGDMPVILGPDGPSLGGFVCPATVIQADLWKLGQLKAGARLRFQPVSLAQALALQEQQEKLIAELGDQRQIDAPTEIAPLTIKELGSPIVARGRVADEEVVYRVAGDHFLLMELGPQQLDIELRFKVHALMLWLQDNPLPGIKELTPGIRSLQIHYQPLTLDIDSLLTHLQEACESLQQDQDLSVPSRIVHLPLSWDDDACQEAIRKYMQSVRPDAPWCPSNLEFIRRINGLDNIETVKRIVFGAAYLVMGLGDVYLGAPVATPLDPRQRLVTTKYNPARTWTAENSVGIGGAYMCVYGMEGPGGYQFVGRTLQMWNRYRQTEAFSKPWLLRFFDQIRFYPVSPEELETIRRDFPLGKYPLKIEETEFNLADYNDFLQREADSIAAFERQRETAFAEELADWKAKGLLTYQQDEGEASEAPELTLPEGITGVDSPVSGSVWEILVEPGQQVEAGEPLMILESMKMEIEVHASCAGRIDNILKDKGQAVTAGQSLMWLGA